MIDRHIQLRSDASAYHRVLREDILAPMCVRSWHSAPETISIQIRLKNEFVTADLSIEQAREFAANIIEACEHGSEAA